MKTTYTTLGFIAISLLIFSCSAKRLTLEDVQKKITNANEANKKAQESTLEALEVRKQYTVDYKAVEINKIEKREKAIDKEIKSLEKSSKNAENKLAGESINTAISAYEEEKKQLEEKRKSILAIQEKDWLTEKSKIDTSFSTIKNQVNLFETSLEDLK